MFILHGESSFYFPSKILILFLHLGTGLVLNFWLCGKYSLFNLIEWLSHFQDTMRFLEFCASVLLASKVKNNLLYQLSTFKAKMKQNKNIEIKRWRTKGKNKWGTVTKMYIYFERIYIGLWLEYLFCEIRLTTSTLIISTLLNWILFSPEMKNNCYRHFTCLY